MSETVLLFQGKYYDVGTKVKFIRKYQWNSVTEGTIIWIEPNSITIKTYNDINYNIFVSDVDRMIKENEAAVYMDTEFTSANRTAMLNRVFAGHPKTELAATAQKSRI